MLSEAEKTLEEKVFYTKCKACKELYRLYKEEKEKNKSLSEYARELELKEGELKDRHASKENAMYYECSRLRKYAENLRVLVSNSRLYAKMLSSNMDAIDELAKTNGVEQS